MANFYSKFFNGVRLRPTRFFVYAALSIFLVFWFIVSLPVLNSMLFQMASVDLLSKFGSNSLIGWRKMSAFVNARNFCLGLTVLVNFSLIGRKGRVLRFVFLAPILLAYQITITWPQWTRLDHAFQAQTQNMMTVGYQDMFSSRQYKKAEVKTFDGFYQLVDQQFRFNRDNLKAQWRIDDTSEMKSLFFLNVVGSLWHFGNRNFPARAGCVQTNENIDFQTVQDSDMTVRTYLDSEIGCCTDYAYLLKYLLDRAGIPNRLVVLPGHLANEAELSSGWHVLDATTGMTISHSWQSLLSDSTLEREITLFPTGAVNRSSRNYSSVAAGLRTAFLSLAVHDSPFRPVYVYELPEYFKANEDAAPLIRKSARR